MHRPAMSTVAEIEAAIEQLPPEDFRTLREWIFQRAERIVAGLYGEANAYSR